MLFLASSCQPWPIPSSHICTRLGPDEDSAGTCFARRCSCRSSTCARGRRSARRVMRVWPMGRTSSSAASPSRRLARSGIYWPLRLSGRCSGVDASRVERPFFFGSGQSSRVDRGTYENARTRRRTAAAMGSSSSRCTRCSVSASRWSVSRRRQSVWCRRHGAGGTVLKARKIVCMQTTFGGLGGGGPPENVHTLYVRLSALRKELSRGPARSRTEARPIGAHGGSPVPEP